jgi:hypothetical protein
MEATKAMTVYGKQCACGSRMHEVHGGYQCMDDDCDKFEVRDWDKENESNDLLLGGFLLIAFIVTILHAIWGG